MFPKDFLFGASMSGFQFEMGYGGDDRDDNSDWYVWVREPENLINGVVSGDLPEYGVGYWKNYEKIHQLAVELGMDIIRIGMEWSRIFPISTRDIEVEVDSEGGEIRNVVIAKDTLKRLDLVANRGAVQHYRRILEDMKKRGLKTMVNLYHFSLPLWIHDPLKVHRGEATDARGWVDVRTVVEFVKYTAYIAWKLGDLVDYWSTMNEPQVVSELGYLFVKAGFPPAYFSPRMYIESLVNQMQAHARAYDLIKQFSDAPVTLIYSFAWVDSLSKDRKVADEAMYQVNYMFIDGITKGMVAGKEREDMKNKLDILGVNYYTRFVVEPTVPVEFDGFKMGWRIVSDYGCACKPGGVSRDGRPVSDMGWEVYPEGLEKVLVALKERYDLPMMVTENGVADATDRLRPYFLVSHLHAVERALEEGVNLLGYLHWSIVDNYEWAHGYSKRFGLAEVDFETKQITPRPSAYIFREIVSKKTLEPFRRYLISPYEIWKER